MLSCHFVPHSYETLKWLSSLPTLMQKSFWWWQCSDRYIFSLSPHLHSPLPPFFPSLISLMVSVDVKHHVYSPCLHVYLLTSYPLWQPASHPFHHPASQSDNSHPHLPINQSVSIISGPASQTTQTHTYPSTSLFPSSAAQPVRQLTPSLTHQPVCFLHQRPRQSCGRDSGKWVRSLLLEAGQAHGRHLLSLPAYR